MKLPFLILLSLVLMTGCVNSIEETQKQISECKKLGGISEIYNDFRWVDCHYPRPYTFITQQQ